SASLERVPRGRRLISADRLQAAPIVDVWVVWLSAAAAVSGAFRSFLSAGETARADRFVNERLRTSFEVSHGALRVLLSGYLNRSPRELEFAFGPAGKPRVCGHSRLCFNMSHSGGL